MVTVESFMKQKCRNVEPDDSDSFRLAVDYGGWQVRYYHYYSMFNYIYHYYSIFNYISFNSCDMSVVPHTVSILKKCNRKSR